MTLPRVTLSPSCRGPIHPGRLPALTAQGGAVDSTGYGARILAQSHDSGTGKFLHFGVILHMVPMGMAGQNDLDVLQSMTKFFNVARYAGQHLLCPGIKQNQPPAVCQ